MSKPNTYFAHEPESDLLDAPPRVPAKPLEGHDDDMLAIGRAIVAAAYAFDLAERGNDEGGQLPAQTAIEALAHALNRPLLDRIRKVRRTVRRRA